MELTSTELAALTATEYAVLLNEETRREAAESGCTFFGTLVEEAEFWGRLGVHTGLDLALSNAKGFYSDLYKDIHNFRPRKNFEGYTLKEIEDEIDALLKVSSGYDEEYTEEERIEMWGENVSLEGDHEKYESMAEALGF